MRRAVIAAQCPVGELWAGVMIQELLFFFFVTVRSGFQNVGQRCMNGGS